MALALDVPLTRRIALELDRPPPPGVEVLCETIRARHGPAVAAILFYGSCLRKGTLEGVLDFYVLVDSYRAAYRRLLPAVFNRLLPPNVFYLEQDTEQGTLRAKYAVISVRDFERCVRPACMHAYIWARFAQPALLAFTRDEEARARAVRATAQAAVTLVQRLAVFLPVQHDAQRFTASALWNEAFARTYGAELRTESQETVRSVYQADPARYDGVAAETLAMLHQQGWLDEVKRHHDTFEVKMPRARLQRARWTWLLRRPLAKVIAGERLIKSAFTFGDWLPYALWKLERHTGTKVELTPRQRRHPFLFGWPVLARLLRRGDLR